MHKDRARERVRKRAKRVNRESEKTVFPAFQFLVCGGGVGGIEILFLVLFLHYR